MSGEAIRDASPGDLLPQGRKFYLHHAPVGDPWITKRGDKKNPGNNNTEAGRQTVRAVRKKGQPA